MLLRQIADTIRCHRMLQPGERAGVAVSGGADSVCLLHALHRLGAELQVNLHVLHIDHGLRGGESDADARFVGELAAELKLPCAVHRIQLNPAAGNLEQAARQARLQFFQQARRDFGLRHVATGHTADDQAETVLFRLLRGTGPGGLAGILPVTAEGLIRPLLALRRPDIEAWLREQGLPWRQDSSNLSPAFTRNRIRHRLLPELSSVVHPNAAGALARLAGIAREEEDYWQAVIEQAFSELNLGEAPLVVPVETLTVPHPAVARRLLRRLCLHVRGDLRELTSEHLESVLRLARRNAGGGAVQLPGLRVARSFHLLRFSAPEASPPANWSVAVPAPGRFFASGVGLEVSEVQAVSQSHPPAGSPDWLYNGVSACLDGERVPFPLVLRNWQAGDSFEWVGAGRTRRMKEWFQEQRIPSWDRLHWPILVAGGRIVWSRRFGVAAGAQAGPLSLRRLLVRELDEVNGRW